MTMPVFSQNMPYGAIVELENMDVTPNQAQAVGDHFAHADGRICKRCDRRIEAGQPARRRGESAWVHDVCPLVDD
jgi:hypothetical protein